MTSRPSSSTSPSSGRSKPAISRSVVVLPEPDGPSSVKNSPCLDLEVDAVDRDDVAVGLAHALEAHGRGAALLGVEGPLLGRSLLQ